MPPYPHTRLRSLQLYYNHKFDPPLKKAGNEAVFKMLVLTGILESYPKGSPEGVQVRNDLWMYDVMPILSLGKYWLGVLVLL